MDELAVHGVRHCRGVCCSRRGPLPPPPSPAANINPVPTPRHPQMTLNTFHMAGRGEANVTLGEQAGASGRAGGRPGAVSAAATVCLGPAHLPVWAAVLDFHLSHR